MKYKYVVPIVLLIPILILSIQYIFNKNNSIKQFAGETIVDAVLVRQYNFSVTSLPPRIYLYGTYFYDADRLTFSELRLEPYNSTHMNIALWVYRDLSDYRYSSSIMAPDVPLNLIIPGQTVTFTVYPYSDWDPTNNNKDMLAGALFYVDSLDSQTFFLGVGTIGNSFLLGTDGITYSSFSSGTTKDFRTIDWNPANVTPIFNISTYPIDKVSVRGYYIPKTYAPTPNNNILIVPTLLINFRVFNQNTSTYYNYKFFLINPFSKQQLQIVTSSILTDPFLNIALIGDRVEIPLLYLNSPLVDVANKHIDLVTISLRNKANQSKTEFADTIGFNQIGIFYYNVTTNTIDNYVRTYGCALGPEFSLPVNVSMNSFIYYIDPEIRMFSWTDPTSGVLKYSLQSPVSIIIYDPFYSRKVLYLTIQNVTLSVKSSLTASSYCHYNLESASITTSRIIDMSTFTTTDSAKITLFDGLSPRAKYYGPLFFRTGIYDSEAGYNPFKIMSYVYTTQGIQKTIIDLSTIIKPIGLYPTTNVIPPTQMHTGIGSPVLSFSQSDYNGQTVSVIQYSHFMMVPTVNVTIPLPRMFTYNITYNYYITPITITYQKVDPSQPDTISNVLVLINITSPSVLAGITTNDGRDIRIFLDNTRGGEYWRDTGLTYGIYDYVPGKYITLVVLLPSITANQPVTIYLYSGFQYAKPVAKDAKALMAQYVLLT